MKTLYLFLLLSCTCSILFAQAIHISGQVTDAKTHQLVGYATIGVKGKSIGTVTDEQGRYNFQVEETQVQANDAVVVSSIGYQTVSMPYSTFKSSTRIRLAPAVTQLRAVKVNPGKVKTKTYGRTGTSTLMVSNMFTQKQLVDDNLGKEQAAILNIDNNCYLKNFNMFVVTNRFKNVKFRLNLYSVKDGYPDSLISDKNILFDVPQKHGWVNVDLTPYQIYLTGYRKIAVAIQWLKSEKIDSASKFFTVSATLSPGHAIFFRDKSQAEWNKISSAYVSFNLTADYFKGSSNEVETTAANEQEPALSDSLQNLLNYTKYAEEAAASPYGKNERAGHSIHLNNSVIYYEVYGKGQPLLLLHGNGQSISAFYRQIEPLSKHYQVIAVDTRAQGKSRDSLNHDLKYELFASDMKQLLDSLQLKKVNVVGWSDGGITALMMALKYPKYVNKIAVMGANLFPEGIAPGTLQDFQKNYHPASKDTDHASANRQRLLKLLLTEPHLQFEDLHTIEAPTLVMAGEHDVILPEHTQGIAKAIPHSQLIIFKGATHYAPQEVPDAFNKAVLDFMR